MDTESAFLAALDAAPNDFTARLVYADWLDEQNDPRAEGYRALAAARLSLRLSLRYSGAYLHWMRGPADPWYYTYCSLPPDWYDLVDDCNRYYGAGIGLDAAARAFARLPADRRAELLGRVPV